MRQNGAEQPKGLLVVRKAPDSLKVPRNQENLSGKDLNEQSGENWVPPRAQSGHEGDDQSGVNWVTTRASDHEGKEQSVASQAVYSTSIFQDGVGCRVPKKVSSG